MTSKKTKSDESSSDGSEDEEEILKNFDQLILKSETLPKKSSERYLQVYNTYKKWKEEKKNSLSTTSEENNLISYFNTLKPKVRPPTLWSIWSMLRTTLHTKDNIDITTFLTLKSIIKNNSKGYKPKKTKTLTWNEIMKFMTTADDQVYLATKVILTFGICGALRCDELTNLKLQDIEDLNDKFLVSIEHNRNAYPNQFVIGNLFYNKIKHYISLRPTDQFTDRFFIHYSKGKCTHQVMGKNKIGEVPQTIASYLKLPNPTKYTGHCFKRTAATLFSKSGANMQMIKQLGMWRSNTISQGYIENSLQNRELIFNDIIHGTTTNTDPKPSTSIVLNHEPTTNEFHQIPDQTLTLTTANKKEILTPKNNKNEQQKLKNQQQEEESIIIQQESHVQSDDSQLILSDSSENLRLMERKIMAPRRILNLFTIKHKAEPLYIEMQPSTHRYLKYYDFKISAISRRN